MSLLLLIISLLILADLILILAVARAPRGYEDQDGFHVLERSPSRRRAVRHPRS